MSKTKGFLLAVAVAAMAFTFSCSSDDSKDDDGGGDGSLVCAEGEAWIRNGTNEGWVLSSNGKYAFIEKGGNTWFYDDDMDGVTWSANGDVLTLSDGKSKEEYTYSVSGDQLTLERKGKTNVYTKRSGIYPVNP